MTRPTIPRTFRVGLLRTHRRHALGWLVAAVTLAISLAPVWGAPGSRGDEGLLLVYPEQVLNGSVANRDFESFYGPANDWSLATAYAALGTNVGVERGLGFVYRLLIVTAIVALAASDGAIVGLAAGVLAAVMLVPLDLAAFAWLGGLAMALCGLWAAFHAGTSGCPRRHRWLAVAGTLAGGAVLFRFDMLPAVALSALPLLLSMSRADRRWYGLGLLVPSAALVAHLAQAGLGPVVSNLLLDAVIRSGSQAGLPFPVQWSNDWLLLVLVIGGSVTMLAAALGARLREGSGSATTRLLVLALFALGILPQALQRADLTHFLYVGCVTVGLLPVALHWLIRSMSPRSRRGAGIAGSTAAALAAFLLAPDVRHTVRLRMAQTLRGEPVAAAWVRNRGRSFPLKTQQDSTNVTAALAEVERHTRSGDRLFVGPANLRRTIYNDIYLYHLLPQLKPSTYHLDMNPGTANRPGGRLAKDVASADVLLLTTTFDPESVWRQIMPFSRLGSTAAPGVVQRLFCLKAIYGEYRVYLRCRHR